MVVKTAREARAAVADLMSHAVVGFDTETRPCFVAKRHNKVALLQLATPETCYLFRLQMLGPNGSLKQLLESPDVQKIGLSVRDDMRALHEWMPFEAQNFVDLQTFVAQFGIADKSLQKIYAIVFGKKISKSQQLSNWEEPILNQKQKNYAAIDAWACLNIYRKLIVGVENEC